MQQNIDPLANDGVLVTKQQEQPVSLADILNALLKGWKTIAFVTSLVLLGALLFLLISKPVYKADAVVQIDQSSKGMSNQLAPIEAMLTGTLPSDGEIELIRSRAVLGRAVDDWGLTISANAKHVFLFGGIAAAINKGVQEPVSPWLWLSSYGWGGEKIKIKSLALPKLLLSETLVLTALPENKFKLVSPSGKLLFSGAVGEDVVNNKYHIHVRTLKARPGTEFEIVQSARYDTIVDLQEDLEIEELGHQSGIIRIFYTGVNSAVITGIINTIVDEYVHLNISRKAEEARKTLDFLKVYLPQSKQGLVKAEKALSDFQRTHETIALDQETKAMLDRTVSVQTQIEQFKLEREDMRQRFSNSHPNIVTLDKKIANLVQVLASDAKISQGMPRIQRELLALSRDVSVSTEMYTYLINRSQELRLMEAGTVSDIRIVDLAETPFEPIFPQPSIVIVVAIFLGFLLSVAIIVVRLSLHHGVTTAEEIENGIGGAVYAVIPFSTHQQALKKNEGILAKQYSSDTSIESLRSLIVNLHFSLTDDDQLNSIVISGVSPKAGKSFISANLAYLLASSGKRVLLVDADMRKGYLAKSFGVAQSPGLSELLSDQVTTPSYLHKPHENLTLITTGDFPPNPLDLLMSKRFKSLMDGWHDEYDHIIIDTPPVLSVADATVISEICGPVFLVVRAGENSIEDIRAAQRRFLITNQAVHGYLLNGFVPSALSAKGYGKYAYYGYGEYK